MSEGDADGPGAGTSTISILLVDDEQDGEVLAVALERHGYRVALAASVAEGNELFDVRRPAVVVVDYGLPDGNGCELCERIRERAGDGVLLIAVTGYQEPEVRAQIRAAEFDHCLIKPISLAELQQLIEDWLATTPT